MRLRSERARLRFNSVPRSCDPVSALERGAPTSVWFQRAGLRPNSVHVSFESVSFSVSGRAKFDFGAVPVSFDEVHLEAMQIKARQRISKPSVLVGPGHALGSEPLGPS